MTEMPALFGLLGSALVALGLYGLAAAPNLIRRIIGFNVAGSGLFAILGAFGAREPVGADPVPQAMIITGVVVALSATALALGFVTRLAALRRPTDRLEDLAGDEG